MYLTPDASGRRAEPRLLTATPNLAVEIEQHGHSEYLVLAVAITLILTNVPPVEVIFITCIHHMCACLVKFLATR